MTSAALFNRIAVLLFILALLPWAWFEAHYMVRQDVAWHLICASRLLAGQDMLTHFFETNPPLIFLLYSMPVAIADAIGAPIYWVPFFFTVALAVVMTALLARLLRCDPAMAESERWILTTGFALGGTLMAGYEMGQREHLIILGLVPLLFCQLFVARGVAMPRWLMLACCLSGAVLVLLKPPLGLLPAVMIAQRLWRRRSWRVLIEIDVLCLAGAAIVYAGVCAVFFRDYLTVILPDVARLYVPYRDRADTLRMCAVGFVAAAGLFAAAKLARAPASAYFLLLMAALALISPLVQMKAFFYHFVPALTLGFMAAGMIVLGLLAEIAPRTGRVPQIIAGLILLSCAYAYHPPNRAFPRHDQFNQLPFTAALDRYAPDGSYDVLWDNIGFSLAPPLYTRHAYASRFAGIWFMLRFADERAKGRIDPEEDKFRRLAVEDLRQYRPRLIAVPRVDEHWPASLRAYPPLTFLSADPDFQDLWKKYRRRATIIVPRGAYTGSPAERQIDYYDIYSEALN